MVKKQMAKANCPQHLNPSLKWNYSFKNFISELQSMKNQVIEDFYSTDFYENHKEIFNRMIDEIEQYQYIIANHYWTNNSMPDEPIIFFKPELRNTQPSTSTDWH